VKYYFDNEGEAMGRSDPTFSYDDFVNCTIEELRKMSFQGGAVLRLVYGVTMTAN
jgi:hypothetical protein